MEDKPETKHPSERLAEIAESVTMPQLIAKTPQALYSKKKGEHQFYSVNLVTRPSNSYIIFLQGEFEDPMGVRLKEKRLAFPTDDPEADVSTAVLKVLKRQESQELYDDIPDSLKDRYANPNSWEQSLVQVSVQQLQSPNPNAMDQRAQRQPTSVRFSFLIEQGDYNELAGIIKDKGASYVNQFLDIVFPGAIWREPVHAGMYPENTLKVPRASKVIVK